MKLWLTSYYSGEKYLVSTDHIELIEGKGVKTHIHFGNGKVVTVIESVHGIIDAAGWEVKSVGK